VPQRVPGLERLLGVIEREHRGAPVDQKLEGAVRVAGELRAVGDELLDHYVQAARAGGRSWTEIGEVLGISKQGAQQRFSAPPASPAAPWPGGFSAAVQAVVADAADVARALGHRYLGTEHLLIALCSPRAGLAGECLARLSVSRARVEAEVVELIGRGEARPEGRLGVTPRSKRALEAARREARRAGHRCPGPEHLLLALYSVSHGVATKILIGLGADAERVRETLAELLAAEAPELAERIRRPPRRRLSRR
jgi:Clp amino terminal domain, pathogenicity island component